MWPFSSPMQKTIQRLLAPRKGILAADETPTTVGRRFSALDIENTPENRRAYREMLFTTPTMANYISGVILQDETIRQKTSKGILLVDVLKKQGVVIGVKVDGGTDEYEKSSIEKITLGIETLPERLKEYYTLGARFAKWRAVFVISSTTPTDRDIQANAELLAQYARLCQKHHIVPIVEPEVLAEGEHTADRTAEVTEQVLRVVFAELQKQKVDLSCMLLKPNMMVPGEHGPQVAPEVVAEKTVECFKHVVPEKVPGIVFLSGGQTEEEACVHLQEIVRYGKECPWAWSFSFGRALQNSAMQTWLGSAENIEAAQALFLRRAMYASAAREGKYETL